jgi:predicted AlkP superfamily phosphohydrolase/phosphomutase
LKNGMRINRVTLMICFVLAGIFLPKPACAYIGPGAGFALLSSLWALVLSFAAAFIALFTLPLRILLRLFCRRNRTSGAKVKRIVVLGLDGLDPQLCDDYMERGLMPNLQKLRETGCCTKLASTFPSLSPVAWSTFSTGVNPGRHGIFDFLTRNPRTYLPELSSARIAAPRRKVRLGKYTIPLGKSRIKFLRRSRSFWSILGAHGIFSHIIRVPITYPPEKFNGALLSAMCTPDLQGTQGSFTFYSDSPQPSAKYTGGTRLPLVRKNDVLCGNLQGPDHPFDQSAGPLQRPFTLYVDAAGSSAEFVVGKQHFTLKTKEFSAWIPVTFSVGLIKIRGICQFYLKRMAPFIELYVSPMNIDPERPALPISHPYYFAVYLAKLFGRYSTLGLAEDTWALNEEVLDEEGFLKQAYRLFAEREQQFFHALAKTRRGVCACVFDGSDRIQHTFYRYLVHDHPANRGNQQSEFKDAVAQVYQKCDQIIGSTLDRLTDGDLFLVLSDHGFKSFVRGINLNTWLRREGYLVLKVEDDTIDYLQNVDWSKTSAYAIGLAGIYLNLCGRERLGVVKKDDHSRLKLEIAAKLTGLMDAERDCVAVRSVYDSRQIYRGAYVDEAPDLIIGCNDGYRISWDSAVGRTSSAVFEDNTKKWSGDHAVDPLIVPGILAGNFKLTTQNPGIADIAPTILEQFGIAPPPYMDGKPLQILMTPLRSSEQRVGDSPAG